MCCRIRWVVWKFKHWMVAHSGPKPHQLRAALWWILGTYCSSGRLENIGQPLIELLLILLRARIPDIPLPCLFTPITTLLSNLWANWLGLLLILANRKRKWNRVGPAERPRTISTNDLSKPISIKFRIKISRHAHMYLISIYLPIYSILCIKFSCCNTIHTMG